MNDEVQNSEDNSEQKRKFTIYDNKTLYIHCPPELAHEFIDLANTEFGGKQYVALRELMRGRKQFQNLAYISADVRELKDRMSELEIIISQTVEKKSEKKTIQTMGGNLEVDENGR